MDIHDECYESKLWLYSIHINNSPIYNKDNLLAEKSYKENNTYKTLSIKWLSLVASMPKWDLEKNQ